MAESAVQSAANWLGMLLVEEGKNLWGAEGKIKELRDELLWMQGFLRDADTITIQYDDKIVRMWVFQIKENVAEAEDIIEDFVVRVISRRRRTGWMNKLKRYSCFLEELVALHQVTSRINSLKNEISMLSTKLQNYGLKTSYGVETYRTQEAQTEQVQQSLKYRHLENEKIVGLEKNAQQVVAALKNSESKRKVVAIYGMGGLGKTTLATKVFHHDEIKKHFRGGRAWAYISQEFQFTSVLGVILADLTLKSTEIFSRKEVKELVSELRDFLKQNKCLVVLDDVWNQRAWDILRAAFTTCGGDSGSRVLLTTRKEEVANYADQHACCKPDPLNKDESLDLLLQTVGWLGREGAGSSETDIPGSDRHEMDQTNIVGSRDVYPMIELGKEMVHYCKGLPLSIILLGGILRKKYNLEEWRSVHKNIVSYLRRGYDHGRSYMEVLVHSYNDLPYHLKPCFLHLANFPEDYEICTEKLYWMWMAEGFVSWSHDKIAGTESLEDVANDYLSDLVQTGVVEIMKKRSNGRIKSIRMHDLMRDVCLQKSAAENFLNIIDHRPDKPLSISSYFVHKRLHRMAIYLASGVNSFMPDLLSSKAHKYLRSLLLIPGHEAEEGEISSIPDSLTSKCHRSLRFLMPIAGHRVEKNKYQKWMECICNDFQWLRVLDVEGLCLEGRLTGKIKNLVHLRHLSVKDTKVSELPSSIDNLRFLEILDLRVSFAGSVVKIPNTLWKLDQLRHLLLPSITYEIKLSKKLQLDTLVHLETLKNLEVRNSRIEDLLKLQNLRKLSVKGIVSEMAELNHIIQSPSFKSGGLQSCSLAVKGRVISDKPSILSSYDCLHRLKVVQQIFVRIENLEFPQSLKKLHLESCKLWNDPMGILGSLCHLKELFLGMDSFLGREMNCEAESFPLLTKLNLRGLVNLEFWTTEQGSMPELKILGIWNCGKLKCIPDVLPLYVHVTCSPCISGTERYGTCICYNAGSFSVKEEFVVGQDKDIQMLLDTLNHKGIVLHGTMGIGKATLARSLYTNRGTWRKFDAIAWTCVPRIYTSIPRHSLWILLRDLAPEISNEALSQKSFDDLVAEIERVMVQKKCLVILTLLGNDLANLDVTFRRQCFDNGSKLLLISNKVPETTFPQFVHKPILLDPEDSLGLFEHLSRDVLHGDDALSKASMGKRMLRYCERHPLSIRMLAGIMATKETLIEWETFSQDLNKLNSTSVQPLPSIFSLSYKDLPVHLRHCFLYLANFPGDTEISTEKLYKMWIAAGFVRLTDEGVQTDDVLENLAESYLSELVQRGMVKVSKQGSAGRIKTCQLQFALLDLCLEKARDELALTIIDQAKPSAPASSSRLTTQHLAVYLNQDENNIFPAPTPSEETEEQLSRVISLLYFPNVSNPVHKEEKWHWFTTICDHFKWLQILDLEGMWTTKGSLPQEVGNLRQLRYLSLKRTWVSELPSSVEKLSNLRTLDLRVLEPIVIPDVLWKLKYLRHLYLPDLTAHQSRKLQLDGLDHLQTLANLHTDKVHLNDVPGLKLLRKISIRKIHAVKELDGILKSLSSSIDLSVNSDVINGNPTILSSFQNLHKVKIKGKISESVWQEHQIFPMHLEELTLKHTKLEQDPIPVLQKLVHLRRLFFDHESFLGKKMTFSGDFHITHLSFRLLSNLVELDDPNGDVHPLDGLVIESCWRLDNVKLRSDDSIYEEPIGRQLWRRVSLVMSAAFPFRRMLHAQEEEKRLKRQNDPQ